MTKIRGRRFDWYPADYLAGTLGKLTLAQHGAFNVILNLIYDSPEGAWKEDMGFLAFACRASEAEVSSAVEDLVRLGKLRRNKRSNGSIFLENRRASDEIQRTLGRIEKARRSARGRWNATEDGQAIASPNASPTAEPSQSVRDAINQQPATSNHQPSTSKQQPGDALPDREAMKAIEAKVIEAAKIDTGRWAGHFAEVANWLRSGATVDDVLDGIRAVAGRPGYQVPNSLRYFTAAIGQARDLRRAAEAEGRAPPVSPARAADAKASRLANLQAAADEARKRGLEPGKPGWPRAAKFGLVRAGDEWELIPNWTPEADGAPA